MRDIKFRGLRTDGKGWAYGDLIHGVGNKEGKIFILPITKFPPHDCDKLDGYEVIPKTIGQFTGVSDINKKEIFTGDALLVNDVKYYVEYNEDLCRYIITTGLGYDTRNCMDLTCDTIYYSEIIENIHENQDQIS